MTCCPNCGHKFTAPKRRKGAKLWPPSVCRITLANGWTMRASMGTGDDTDALARFRAWALASWRSERLRPRHAHGLDYNAAMAAMPTPEVMELRIVVPAGGGRDVEEHYAEAAE